MDKWPYIIIAFILFPLLSCASSYNVYRDNLVRGKDLMKQGQFEEARSYFVKASESQRLAESLAFAATASYNMNDLKAAERYIAEAEKQDGRGFSDLRIAGYKALIYLKEGKKSEGIRALQEYTTLYSHLYPLTNIKEVKAMVKDERIDLGRLETLLDEQITLYEDEVDQFQKTGTGFYDRPGTLRGGPMIRP
jgi:tetratricopeptide (TPR) repeat protein